MDEKTDVNGLGRPSGDGDEVAEVKRSDSKMEGRRSPCFGDPGLIVRGGRCSALEPLRDAELLLFLSRSHASQT